MNLMRRLFTLFFNATALRHGVFPTSADGVAALAITLTKNAVAWTWGAWVQIVLAAGVTVETKIVGFTLENFVGVAAQGEVMIGTGVAPAGAELGRYPISSAIYYFPEPLYIQAAIGLVARYRNANAVADTVDIKLLTETGF